MVYLVEIDLCSTDHQVGYMGRKERNILLNDTLNIFYFWLFGIGRLLRWPAAGIYTIKHNGACGVIHRRIDPSW